MNADREDAIREDRDSLRRWMRQDTTHFDAYADAPFAALDLVEAELAAAREKYERVLTQTVDLMERERLLREALAELIRAAENLSLAGLKVAP